RRVLPSRLEHRGLPAQVVGEHVGGLLRDGLSGELARLRVLLPVHGLDGLAVEGEGRIVTDALGPGGAGGGDGAEREPDGRPVVPAGATAQRAFSSKRTGKMTHTATASFPRRAGSNNHVLMASMAARSRSGRPAERWTWIVPTFPLVSTSNRSVTTPSAPSRRAASG